MSNEDFFKIIFGVGVLLFIIWLNMRPNPVIKVSEISNDSTGYLNDGDSVKSAKGEWYAIESGVSAELEVGKCFELVRDEYGEYDDADPIACGEK